MVAKEDKRTDYPAISFAILTSGQLPLSGDLFAFTSQIHHWKVTEFLKESKTIEIQFFRQILKNDRKSSPRVYKYKRFSDKKKCILLKKVSKDISVFSHTKLLIFLKPFNSNFLLSFLRILRHFIFVTIFSRSKF